MGIHLYRAEGPVAECKPYDCASWDAANTRLQQWARTAPKDGSYNKTDVTVNLSDDFSVSFRFDLTRDHRYGVDLRRHTLEHCQFFAGVLKPFHLSKEQYERYLDEFVETELRAEYARAAQLIEEEAA